MMLETALLTIGVVAVVVCLLLVAIRISVPRALPGAVLTPSHHWLLGDSREFAGSPARFDFLHEALLKVGFRNMQISVLGLKPLLLLTDKEDIEWVLKTRFDDFEKGDWFHFAFDEVLGSGIFNADGDQWRNQRKLASFVFSSRILKDLFVPVIIEHSNFVVERLKKLDRTEAIDIQELCARFTMDSFCKIAFGVHTNSLLDVDSSSEVTRFARAFDEAQRIVATRFYGMPPLLRLRKFFRLGLDAELVEHVKVLDGFVYSMIDKRIEELAQGRPQKSSSSRSKYMDLIGLCLENMEKNNLPVDRKYIRDLVLNFIIAGRDTTAGTLAWVFYELALRPEINETLVKEIRAKKTELEAKNTPSAEIPLLVASDCEYLNGVFWEALRLHPAVPLDSKLSLKTQTLPCGVTVGPGTICGWSVYSLGRWEKLWGKDVMDFVPKRWFGGEPKTQYEFPVFNAGFRNCMGKQLALIEAKLLIGAIAPQFRYRLSPGQKVVYHPNSITLWMKDPLLMTVEPRS